MLEYDRIDISEGIDINKSSDKSKECHICHYWYFLYKNFSYQPYVCNGCHDLMQKAMNFNDVVIASVKGNDYRIHFWYMSKNDAISIMHNSNLTDNIRLPQLTGHVKHFSDENKLINFLVTDKKLLKKCNKRWCKIKSLFKKE